MTKRYEENLKGVEVNRSAEQNAMGGWIVEGLCLQPEDGIRGVGLSRGLGDVYKGQELGRGRGRDARGWGAKPVPKQLTAGANNN